jgi:hypothetical protein
MPQSSNHPKSLEARRRAKSQLTDMRGAAGEAGLGWDTQRPADYNFLFVPDRFLVDADQADEDRILGIFNDRRGDIPHIPEPVRGAQTIDRLDPYHLPDSPDRRKRRRDVLDLLRVYDDELGVGVVTPEHYVHVAGTGDGRACPATEPTPAQVPQAWPDAEPEDSPLGAGVDVVVIDTGWPDPAVESAAEENARRGAYGQLPVLPAYAGHGSFAEAVLHSRAPAANIEHLEFPISSGGAVNETDLADLLAKALEKAPKVISMSAGCHTRHDRPLKAFERVWKNVPDEMKDQVVIVTAAGNDASPSPFYPAASDWAIGVGSLDRDNKVSDFSNYRQSADVFILGREHVNKFPRGRYTCHWAPYKGQPRTFTTGWAEWSGTSFATPLLAGLITAYISQNTNVTPAQAARDLVRSKRVWRNHPLYGDHRKIRFEQI